MPQSKSREAKIYIRILLSKRALVLRVQPDKIKEAVAQINLELSPTRKALPLLHFTRMVIM